MKDKLEKRILNWDNKLLSKAGKELLIRIVAQSLPSYAMNAFLLPISLCRDLEQIWLVFCGVPKAVARGELTGIAGIN